MNFAIDKLLPDLAENCSRREAIMRHLLRGITIALGCALLIFILFLSLGRFRLSQIGRELFIAFTYCILISLPSIALVTRISFRYTDRFPRLVILMQAAILVCMAMVGSLAANVVFQLLHVLPPSEFWREFRSSAPFSAVVSLMFGLSISAYETLRYKLQATALELRTRQLEQERAYKLLAESRLSSLESRIHPHFLFNTLNSIAALIPKDPQLAEATVGKLASLLRFSLNANQAAWFRLARNSRSLATISKSKKQDMQLA